MELMKKEKEIVLSMTEDLYKLICHVSGLKLTSEFKKQMRDKVSTIDTTTNLKKIKEETEYFHETIKDMFVVMVDAKKLIEDKEMDSSFVMSTIMALMVMPVTNKGKKEIRKRVRSLCIAETYREISKGNVKQIK